MGCGSSASAYRESNFEAPPQPNSSNDTQKEAADPPASLPTKISAQALQVLSQEVRWKELESKATAHHAPDLGRSNPYLRSQHSRPSVDSMGPLDKDDLSYGPSFGPEELQSADVAKVLELPIQPGAYYVGGILAKTDNCQVHLGATYSNKTKIIVKRVSRITSAQPFQTHVNEVRCLLRLHHQHIVKLLGVFDGPANFLDIILEYCPLGALRNYVNEVEESRRLLQVLCDVAEALAYIHREWFAHLDVKPHNILVVLEGEVQRGKLCDFGTATRIGASGCLCGVMGTPGYRAPEIDRSQEFHAYKADVWSLGKVAEFVETSSKGLLGVRYEDFLDTVPGLRPDMQRCQEIFESGKLPRKHG